VEYGDYPTPYISEFRDEAVIFPKSFVAGPKCAPSRYSTLTGRMPSRGLFAIERTLEDGDGSDGVSVTIDSTKLWEDDTVYNLPRVLQDNGYYTGSVGKWHLMPPSNYREDSHRCAGLLSTGNAELYGECTNVVKQQGFDYVDGWYYSNVVNGGDFSHNPEWMVSRAQKFIDDAVDEEDKPFFLYFASTLTHDSGDVYTALNEYSYTDSPKGELSGDEVPDDTTMDSREEIWMMAELSGNGQESLETQKEYAMHYWVDEQFGALINYLKHKGIYDETLIILQSDHGMPAKGTLYEHGSRIWNFMRYPPLFGKTQTFLHEDLVVSNVDTAPTIFNLIDATVPEDYHMDGTSWLHAVEATVDTVTNSEYSGDICCEYRFVDMYNSRSIVSANYQYIWRMNGELEESGGVTDLYVNVHDTEQLYDLKTDPSEQINVIGDETYSEVIAEMQWLMREYIASTCPAEDGECPMPSDPYTHSDEEESDLVDLVMEQISAAKSNVGTWILLDPSVAPTKAPTVYPTAWWFGAKSNAEKMDSGSGSGSESDSDSDDWPTPKPTKKPTPKPTKSPSDKSVDKMWKKETKEPTKSKHDWPTPKPTKKTWPSMKKTDEPTKEKWPTPPPSWPTKQPTKKTKEPTKKRKKETYNLVFEIYWHTLN